jgi:subtilisin family serine protease
MIRIGIADSGVDGAATAQVVARKDFLDHAASRSPGTTPRDPAGHGSALAAVIAAAGEVELLDARIFDASLRTSAAQAAAAIDWLVSEGVQLLNLSFGLREDRAVLREACARAIEAGVVIVASAPARGEPVFPASYPHMLRATGDARCTEGEISWLGTAQADAGGRPRTPCGRVAGASAGCAHVCAALAQLMTLHPRAARDDLLDALRRNARYQGPERRNA